MITGQNCDVTPVRFVLHAAKYPRLFLGIYCPHIHSVSIRPPIHLVLPLPDC